MSPQVSVVMPVYNGERYLAEAIASILGQTYADFEFIIVDDGSTDGSAEIICEFAERDSRIHFVRLRRNQGEAWARNTGIADAKGKYVAMMDCDDVCLPDRLRKQMNYLEAHPEIDVIGITIWLVDQDLKPLAPIPVPLEHPLIVWGQFFGANIAHPVLLRREPLTAVGGYLERRSLCVDKELWSRLLPISRFANLSDVLMLYRQHPQSSSIKHQKRQQAESAEILKRTLERLWGEAPDGTLRRFHKIRRRETGLANAELKLLRIEMTRLADSLVDAGWVKANERPLLTAEMERILLRAMPRYQRWYKYLTHPRSNKHIFQNILRKFTVSR